MHIFELFVNAVKEEARYKINLIGGILALLILYSLQLVFFDVISLLVTSDDINTNWLVIFFMTYALGGLIVNFFSSAIAGFFRHLTQGKLDTLLVRPINFFVLVLFRWCQTYYLLVALFLIAICMILNTIDLEPFLASPVNAFLYLLVLIAGVMANVAFILVFNSFSFITQRQMPVDYIYSSISTFSLLPATFYSKTVLYFLLTAFPMIVFASVALDALHNGLTQLVFIFLLVVSITSFFVIKIVRGQFNRFDSIGG
ncbi:ABC-2 family transporter protein [Pseudomonas sp. NFX98]|uniref:ABC-2 family transporter protein n=1 Tax=Pseudomonas sp. NFX98 TaxID=3399122 RepID=UPI0039FC92BB